MSYVRIPGSGVPDVFVNQGTVIPTGTTVTIDWSLGNIITIDLQSATGTVAITHSNGLVGIPCWIFFIQGSTARQVTFTNMLLADSGSSLVLPTTNDSLSRIMVLYNGTSYSGPGNVNFA